MKPYRNTLLLLLFVVANYYVLRLGFRGMTASSDLGVMAGVASVAALAIVDVLLVGWLVRRAWRRLMAEDGGDS